MVIGIFVDQRLNDKPMTIRGDGEQRRDFTYVGDVVKANILAAKTSIFKLAINCCHDNVFVQFFTFQG